MFQWTMVKDNPLAPVGVEHGRENSFWRGRLLLNTIGSTGLLDGERDDAGRLCRHLALDIDTGCSPAKIYLASYVGSLGDTTVDHSKSRRSLFEQCQIRGIYARPWLLVGAGRRRFAFYDSPPSDASFRQA